MRDTRSSCVVVLLLILVLLPACSLTSSPTVEEDRFPPGWHPTFTTVWDSKSGIDIRGRGAELIRASYESMWIAQYYGNTKTFPGYISALGTYREKRDIDDVIYQGDTPATSHWRSTNYARMFDLVSTDSMVSAFVCMINLRDSADPSVDVYKSPPRVQDWMQITLKRDRSTGRESRPSVGQYSGLWLHERQIPNRDVFESWSIVQMRYRSPKPLRCTEWAATVSPGAVVVEGKYGPELSGESVSEPLQPQFPKW